MQFLGLLGLVVILGQSVAVADQTSEKQKISIEFFNGGITSSAENLSAAEFMLRKEALKVCGADVTGIAINSLELRIEGCGMIDLKAKRREPITRFRCYPRVNASAEIICGVQDG